MVHEVDAKCGAKTTKFLKRSDMMIQIAKNFYTTTGTTCKRIDDMAKNIEKDHGKIVVRLKDQIIFYKTSNVCIL